MAIAAPIRFRISESMNVPTSLDGMTVFGRVETANGRRDVFRNY